MKKSEYTLGVIGLGQMAADNHLPALAELGIRPIWYLDFNSRKCKLVSKVFGGSYHAPSVALAELPEPDIVLLSSPYGTRPAYYDQFTSIWPSCAIYIEKPIALTVHEHDAIASLREPYLMSAGYNKRSFGRLQFIRKIIECEVFGKLKNCSIAFGGFGIKTGGRYVADLQLSGGGMLFEVVVHYIDAVNFVLSASKSQMQSVNMEFDHGFDIHTEGQYALATPYGSIECAIKSSVVHDLGNEMQFVFENATISSSLFADELSLQCQCGRLSFALELPLEYQVPCVGVSSVCAYWREFLRGIATETCNYTNLSMTRVTTEVIEGLYSNGGRPLCIK